jgi:hypothetical protein
LGLSGPALLTQRWRLDLVCAEPFGHATLLGNGEKEPLAALLAF